MKRLEAVKSFQNYAGARGEMDRRTGVSLMI